MTESRKVFMENKMTKTRMTVEEIDSPLNSLFGQKISVREENFNQKSKNPFSNLDVMLNLFQHLTNKHRLKKDLCLLISCEDGQMLKQHASGFLTLMENTRTVGCVVLTHREV